MEVTLALNRCLQFGMPRLATLIFGSEKGDGIWRTYVLLTLIGGYGIFYTIFGIPVVFSASIKHFIWEPHLFYDKTLIPKVLFIKKTVQSFMYVLSDSESDNLLDSASVNSKLTDTKKYSL